MAFSLRNCCSIVARRHGEAWSFFARTATRPATCVHQSDGGQPATIAGKLPRGSCDGGSSIALRDLVPVASEPDKRASAYSEPLVLGELEGLAGEVEVEVLYQPRPDYARGRLVLESRGALGLWGQLDGAVCVLRGEIPL